MLFGYARVSTVEQETRLQLDALRRVGAERVYWEKTSSVGQRPELQRLLADMGQGDTLLVYKLDRLARSLKDLLTLLERLEAKGCALRSLTEPVDTQSLAGRMMLQMLGAVAEFERGLIRERSIAGQRAAMARGIKCGRPRGIGEGVEAECVRLYETGWFTMRVVAEVFEVHPSTVKRAIYRVHKPGHSSLR
jgi:DNA invertase Pin-like site-specific DNA recombinase